MQLSGYAEGFLMAGDKTVRMQITLDDDGQLSCEISVKANDTARMWAQIICSAVSAAGGALEQSNQINPGHGFAVLGSQVAGQLIIDAAKSPPPPKPSPISIARNMPAKPNGGRS